MKMTEEMKNRRDRFVEHASTDLQELVMHSASVLACRRMDNLSEFDRKRIVVESADVAIQLAEYLGLVEDPNTPEPAQKMLKGVD